MTLDRCFIALERNQIPYSHSVHPPAWTARQVARAEHMPAHRLAKVVVYDSDRGYGMLLLPADSVVDFAEVLRLLGLHQIRLASEVELGTLFPDCELGAMPPFGNLNEMPVLVDESLRTKYVGPYAIQAAIAALHARATSAAETDWRQIAVLYDRLEELQPSPVVSLNRAVAIAMADWATLISLKAAASTRVPAT